MAEKPPPPVNFVIILICVIRGSEFQQLINYDYPPSLSYGAAGEQEKE